VSFSPALSLYRGATRLLGPFAGAWLKKRARAGKEDSDRMGERFARYTQTRPHGTLIWLHAASVGESSVALALIEALAARDSELHFLISTGTRTSADLIAQRAPPRTTHIYGPIDRVDVVRRFLTYWRPDLGVFVESEVWPNLILEARKAHLTLALVNARMSPKSLARWRNWGAAGARIMRAFDWVAAADARTAEALSLLRGETVPVSGNLKLAAPPPRIDADARARLAQEIGARPLWLAASTHAGEEEIAIDAHARLRETFADALLIIAPRHPERGETVSARAANAPRRAHGAPIGAAPIYVADTLGELGTLYDLAPVALVAGSLLPTLKGHNPVEPAKLGAAILTGPYVESFEDLYAALFAAVGATKVETAHHIADAVAALWRDDAKRTQMCGAARAVVEASDTAFENTLGAMLSLLPQHTRRPRRIDASA
jgi:3-deoxy-D-manno-octulosonic-acid transferase